jgi:hypothetical protein
MFWMVTIIVIINMRSGCTHFEADTETRSIVADKLKKRQLPLLASVPVTARRDELKARGARPATKLHEDDYHHRIVTIIIIVSSKNPRSNWAFRNKGMRNVTESRPQVRRQTKEAFAAWHGPGRESSYVYMQISEFHMIKGNKKP